MCFLLASSMLCACGSAGEQAYAFGFVQDAEVPGLKTFLQLYYRGRGSVEDEAVTLRCCSGVAARSAWLQALLYLQQLHQIDNLFIEADCMNY